MHIDALIHTFSQNNLIQYLRYKIPTFKPDEDDLSYLFDDEVFEKYESIEKIGEATINGDDLIVIASKTSDALTEKTGKKNQYEIAKKILKEEVKDASLFVFYDDDGNFRFSFVNANYLGTKRSYTDFKRYSYFVNKDKLNKTFKQQVGDCSFGSVDEIIKAFSVEPLNKLFYKEVSKAFYELIGGKINIASKRYNFDTLLELPSTPLANRKIYQEFGVRLIGRTIFCWFLKNKKSPNKLPLIPESWLHSGTVEILSNGGFNYYHDYLEKLFFLILNKKQEQRIDYDLPDGHETIPFLNGGLFEPHTDDFFPKDSSGIHKVSYNLNIPNEWFFKLFTVLEQFNFTIDENSISDAEVSIDPEMLGTIFENLLAEIDPDTEKSARKATGSFYTPREIVDYMVEQSLTQYLITKTGVEDEIALQNLFKEGGENDFNEERTEELLEALNTVKILDPACGSGAFPMGALHKIITILHKLDPDASWWKEKQIENIPNALARKYMQEKLDTANADYIRKLGIIQNSIYGVDIQPIATEISKLRSFLSLIIDENIVDDAENRGIEPLPNLEFKFVTANTLIGLPDESGQQGMFDNFEELQQLEQLRADYLQSSGKKKNKIKQSFLKVQKKAFINQNNLFTDHNSRAFKIISWNPFKDDASSWFDPEWMFGIEKFDIIIGNPPYGVSVKNEYRKEVLKHLFKVPDYEIYYFFIEVAQKYLKKDGIKSFIIPNSFLFNVYATKYRIRLMELWSMFILDCTAFKIFEKATVLNAITIFRNNNDNAISYKKTSEVFNFQELIQIENSKINYDKILKFNQNWSLAFKLDKKSINLIEKIKSNSEPLMNLFPEYSQGLIAYDKYQGQDEFTIKNRVYHFNRLENENLKEWIYGSDVTPFQLNWNEQEWIDYCDNLANPRQPKFFKGNRVLIREITNPSIFAAFTKTEYYHDPAIIVVLESPNYNIYSLLAFLNSKLATFYHFNSSPKATKGAFPKILVEDVKNFPLKIIDEKVESKIEKIVKEIILKGYDNSRENLVELNSIIYKMYNLTFEETLIIDTEFELTKEQYENYSIENE
ncbi:Eco57I restriction-modification methylase domain-containing protein [Aureibaculum luteum]|uniref:Eco57I restriction-modification methylase domain-containing protein n=1 Tax=Aureibaculum luteum TaxID=1548456 RepID=UPI000E5025DF|nr:TaqI-like C-terminal specificity domain-containing protein [Aureibaculum luteum]